MSCLVAVQAAFELFVFGSRHDFLISDFLPFCFSHAYQIYLLLAKMVASYSYFSLAILDRGRQIEESKFPRRI